MLLPPLPFQVLTWKFGQVIWEDGHTYERATIEERCAVADSPRGTTKLVPNELLKALIYEWSLSSGRTALIDSGSSVSATHAQAEASVPAATVGTTHLATVPLAPSPPRHHQIEAQLPVKRPPDEKWSEAQPAARIRPCDDHSTGWRENPRQAQTTEKFGGHVAGDSMETSMGSAGWPRPSPRTDYRSHQHESHAGLGLGKILASFAPS